MLTFRQDRTSVAVSFRVPDHNVAMELRWNRSKQSSLATCRWSPLTSPRKVWRENVQDILLIGITQSPLLMFPSQRTHYSLPAIGKTFKEKPLKRIMTTRTNNTISVIGFYHNLPMCCLTMIWMMQVTVPEYLQLSVNEMIPCPGYWSFIHT